MTRIRLPFLVLLIFSLTLFSHLSGCAGPSYYAQAISGHMGLMRSRVSIEELLDDPQTDPELAARLKQTEQMRQYAHERLALSENGNYSRFAATNREAVTWNVVATPEFSLEPRLWCFPVAGCVAYRGYFKKQKAQAFADKMESKSMDVLISPAVAYSTLGWFEDPLLDTMLQYSDAVLAGIIFHELAHERLYIKSDTAFNEAFASFVEETGVRLWLSESDRSAELEQWKNRKRASRQYNQLLKEFRPLLAELYASEISDASKREQKLKYFDQLRSRYRELVNTQWQGKGYFDIWMDKDLNNARLALINSYEGGICAFETLFQQAGQKLERFYELAAEKAEMDMAQRQVWLTQACTEFASAGDL